ncbi:hypothetical protein LOTGIDRAFT_237086 [Lottia gigantea]|uniref:FH2 domain-containing protein n=1 Tax=Lottia gigantea TaxID=225164 RepID=V3ZDZ7_LOTGI|nr:hypothetical protein LOTGIDRAFT_237086 [Lottia gigantea]ESO82282.1 hypothetical protein LOTGIDRAFT_237086 [Lottia gigantea]
MEWRQPRPGRNRNVFKGSFLVSTLLDQHSNRFKSRAAAVKFAKKLFRESQVKSIFGANYFEDSPHLYMWNDDVITKYQRANTMTSHVSRGARESRYDQKVIEDAKNRILNRGEQINLVKPFHDSNPESDSDYYRPSEISRLHRNLDPRIYHSYSTESSLESQNIYRQVNKIYSKHKHLTSMSKSRNHAAIPEEKMDIPEVTQGEYMTGTVTGTMNSQASSAATENSDNGRRWGETAYSYSDNEKQLIEEMKRMKKEHQYILKTYEERINKLMAKMHELRSIAEMLENSSTKSSPYGILPNKANILSIIGSKLDEERKEAGLFGADGDDPPPLPPRPVRGNKIYPNKPIVHTGVIMKHLPWSRIIVNEEGENGPTSIWQSMMEPKIDVEELERLFCATTESLDDISLFDDIYVRRGRPKHQLVNIYEGDKAQRIVAEMRNLRCSLNDLIHSVTVLDSKDLNQESLAQLLDLLCSSRDMEKIVHHVKRKGAAQLDYPEYLISEISKVDHFKERLEFLRFREKLQINLFEIEQQLRELHTACDEICNSLALKNLLGTLLTVGNYLNGGSEKGQADGYNLDILNKLKDVTDKSRRGNLLEFVVKSYCKLYESDVETGCPTRFRLPEPSNMRHAAQVSFEDIHRALNSLRQELHIVKDRIEGVARTDNSNTTYQLKVLSENYFTCAVEVLAEEDRLLEDTKKYFKKTSTYFIHDRKTSPQDFFQIWATFLHDTKFYWKLSHRNLAKLRFEMEFSAKNQMSSTSHHSHHGKYRNEVKKHLSTLEQDRHLNRAQQLKHINNWIESVGKYTEEINSDIPHYNPRSSSTKHDPHSTHRPSSPKPLTSTPPNVHKPLALNHNSPTLAVPPYYGNGNHNYINQESPYDTLTRGNETDDVNKQTSSPPEVAPKKNSNQFSLKSWLKREQTKRNDDNNVNQKQNTPSSTGTLGKIRNSVVNKFSNSKRPLDAQHEVNKPEVDRRLKDSNKNNSSSNPGHQTIVTGNEINVNMVTGPNIYLERNKGDYQGLYFEVPITRDGGFGQNSNPSTLDSTKSRDNSPPKYDYNKEQPFGGQFTSPEKKSVSPHNDVNNNKKSRGIPPETPPKPARAKDRVNMGHSEQTVPHLASTDPQMVVAEAVPVYTAKSTPNYENQTKVDHRSQVLRGHAEPVHSSHKPQLSNSSEVYRNELARKSEMFLKGSSQKTLSPENYRMGSGSKSNSDFSRSPQQHFDGYPARCSASTQNILERQLNHLSPPTMSDPRNMTHRTTQNSSSVTNLIDRFEKSPVQMDSDKQPSMTSTPLTHRRNNQLSPEQDSYQTPHRGRHRDQESYSRSPPRSKSQDRSKPRSRESSQQRYHDRESSHRQQDHRGAQDHRGTQDQHQNQIRKQDSFRQQDEFKQHDYNHNPSEIRSSKTQTYPVPKPRRNQPQVTPNMNQYNQQQYNQNQRYPTSNYQQPSDTQQYHQHFTNKSPPSNHQQIVIHQIPTSHQTPLNHHTQFNHHTPPDLQTPASHKLPTNHQAKANHQTTSNHYSSQPPNQYQIYKATPVTYNKSDQDNTYGFSDHEDNYTDQLRKASKAKSSAVFDRYTNSTTSPQYGRQSGTMAVVKPTVMQPKPMDI